MAQNLRTTVILDGRTLQSVSSININQVIFDHHHFEVQLPLTSLVDFEAKEDPMPALQACIGRSIEITIATATDTDRDGINDKSIFLGVVTAVNVIGPRWQHSMLSIVGGSPTILMDGINDTKAYFDMGIKQIYDECVGKHLASEINVEDNLLFTGNLSYRIQYRESDFQFIKRVCYQNGQWCYYDGTSFCFGLKPTKEPITLYSSHILHLDFSYSIAPSRPSVNFRDYKNHKVETFRPKKPDLSDDMANNSLNESANVFTGAEASNIYMPSSHSAEGFQYTKEDHQQYLDQEESRAMANLLVVNCQSDVAGISVGSRIKIDHPNHCGDFIVTNITHSCYGARTYSNQFTAIPVGATYEGTVNIKFPELNDTVAIVSDNKDPEKLGRVKVLFDWVPAVETPWLRMVMPHTGDNRGFYFVPEVGDEVMVGFELGVPDFPYIIGSLYNGQNNFGKRANDDNNLKSIKTRSGNEILFDDGGQIIIRNNHNNIVLSCADDGKITIETEGDMEFIAGKNMEFTVGENLSINVAKDMTTSVSENMEITAGKELTTEAGSNAIIKAAKKMNLKGGSDVVVAAGTGLSLEAGTEALLKGGVTTTVEGGIKTVVKGGVVTIN